jgi:hypothetical protein
LGHVVGEFVEHYHLERPQAMESGPLSGMPPTPAAMDRGEAVYRASGWAEC